MSEYSVPVEDALGRLAVIPDYDPGDGLKPCVHSFAQSAFGLLGAHWDLDSVREFFEKHGVEEAGEQAQAMRHGLVVVAREGGRTRTIFFETRAES